MSDLLSPRSTFDTRRETDMTAISRRPRLARALGPIVAAALTLSACGGSAVEDSAAAPGGAVVNEQPADGAATDAVPAAMDSGGAAAVAPDTSTGADGPAGGTGNQSKPGQGAAAATDKGKATKAGAGTAAAGGLEAAIARYPIFGGTGACKPATLSVVNVGNVSTLSGVLGELHEPGKFALQAFVASQNACGGLNGHKINMFMEDDQGDPSTAASKIQELASKNIIAFVGNIQSLTIDGALPSIKKAGIPVIGGDIVSNTWYTNPLLFPQGSPPQAVSYGFAAAAKNYFKATKEGHMWCLEVPRACEQLNRAWLELAPKVGVTAAASTQMSITNPSYVQQCLDFKSRNIEAVALSMDAASMGRIARSCNSVGYHPKWIAHPLGLGNQNQFLGLDLLNNTYVPLNVFPWMGNTTPAEKYWQQMRARYIPGQSLGGASSSAWTAGALLVAASAGLSADNPTKEQLFETLWTFKGQPSTTLGGLTAPLTFNQNGNPRIPYCLFGAISNDKNDGWKPALSKAVCTDIVAPSDPQNAS